MAYKLEAVYFSSITTSNHVFMANLPFVSLDTLDGFNNF